MNEVVHSRDNSVTPNRVPILFVLMRYFVSRICFCVWNTLELYTVFSSMFGYLFTDKLFITALLTKRYTFFIFYVGKECGIHFR